MGGDWAPVTVESTLQGTAVCRHPHQRGNASPFVPRLPRAPWPCIRRPEPGGPHWLDRARAAAHALAVSCEFGRGPSAAAADEAGLRLVPRPDQDGVLCSPGSARVRPGPARGGLARLGAAAGGGPRRSCRRPRGLAGAGGGSGGDTSSSRVAERTDCGGGARRLRDRRRRRRRRRRQKARAFGCRRRRKNVQDLGPSLPPAESAAATITEAAAAAAAGAVPPQGVSITARCRAAWPCGRAIL